MLIFVLTFSSCASIFNSKSTSLTIVTSVPSNLVLGKDTIKSTSNSKLLAVYRDKKPLLISVYNDSLTKTVRIKSKNSVAFWSNLGFCYGFGMLIDMKNPKRFTYPKYVYINLSSKDSSYLKYKPLDKTYAKYSNIFKVTPLKTVGITNPSIELSYERRTGHSFATQVMASYLLPKSVVVENDFNPDITGFRVSVEEKYYLNKSAPLGSYLSFEFDYLNNQYNDIWNFGIGDVYSDSTYNYTNYPDAYTIKKQTYSFNFKFGHQLIIKRLSIDFYAGLGLRYKDVRHFDRINPNDEMEIPIDFNAYYITNREGKYWTMSLPLNIRIGWTF